jgi:O-antigen/teichoic acid export membrane protein
MEESALGEVCPACGFKRTVFAPDAERLSPMRRMILDAHIHPIIVHFPQAFALFLLLLSGIALFAQNAFHDHTILVIRYLAMALPLTVAGALISGVVDAKARLKKFITPILYAKIIAGSVFFIASVAAAYFAFILKEFHQSLFFAMSGLFILTFVCSVVVGKLGALLACTKVQG